MDVGDVRIGIALSDPSGIICTPLTTLPAKGPPHDQQRIADLAAEHDAEAIIVGLPVNMDGAHGRMARKVQAFCRVLRSCTALPVRTQDERLTSAEAESRLRDAGVQPSRHKGRVDAAAAALILERFLSSRREG